MTVNAREIDIASFEIMGNFKCDCSALVDFQVDEDSYSFPECDTCVIEYRVYYDEHTAKVVVEYNGGQCNICKKHCLYIEYGVISEKCCDHSPEAFRRTDDCICALCEKRRQR